MKEYIIDIYGLSNKKHGYSFVITNDLFAAFECDMVNGGDLTAELELVKSETMVQATFLIKGTVSLTCDRSLDEFDFPISCKHTMYYKYGDAYDDQSDDIVIIPFHQQSLDFGSVMYDFILLEVPVKKLHPRYRDEEQDEEEAALFFTTSTDEVEDVSDSESGDTRWNILKNLKFN